jgi:hypothetical protein
MHVNNLSAPLLRFMDGRHVLMELSAESFPVPHLGQELVLVLDNGTLDSRWLVDRVQTLLPVRPDSAGDTARLVALVGQRVTVVELLRLEVGRA